MHIWNISYEILCCCSVGSFKLPTRYLFLKYLKKINILIIPLRRLKVAILKLYLVNIVHAATSRIQLPLPLKTATSSNLFIYRLEEVAGFRGIGSWIPEATACTLLIRYIRENFKIATFSCLSCSSRFVLFCSFWRLFTIKMIFEK